MGGWGWGWGMGFLQLINDVSAQIFVIEEIIINKLLKAEELFFSSPLLRRNQPRSKRRVQKGAGSSDGLLPVVMS